MTQPPPLAGLDREELLKIVSSLDEPDYRVDQIFKWFYRKRAKWFDEMTDLTAELRGRLPEVLGILGTNVTDVRTDKDGTLKLLVRLGDGHTIESALIPQGQRRTGCVSTQAGCPVGCLFCASGAKGLARNLDAAEIVEQALHLTYELPGGKHLTHLVFMGIGEGLLNFDALARAIRTLNAPWGMNIGARRMTVSTVGIPGTITRLAALGLQVNLAVSLHAPTDELRARLIPYGGLLKVEELMGEAEDYFVNTGREVTFEYVLLAGVNDSRKLAERLADTVKPCHASVNLIAYNEVQGTPFRRPSADAVKAFRSVLEKRGVRVTFRRSRGTGVAAACGQLRLDALPRDDDV